MSHQDLQNTSRNAHNVPILLSVVAAGRFDLLESHFHHETANYHRPLSQVQVTEFFGSVSNVQTLQTCGDYHGRPATGKELLVNEAGADVEASTTNNEVPVRASSDKHEEQQQQQQLWQQPRAPVAGPDMVVLAGFAGLCAVAVFVSMRA
jgi:hypothetical protein